MQMNRINVHFRGMNRYGAIMFSLPLFIPLLEKLEQLRFDGGWRAGGPFSQIVCGLKTIR